YSDTIRHHFSKLRQSTDTAIFKKRILLFLLILGFGCMEAYSQGNSNMLLDLARIQDGVESKRVSSYNKSGANRDRFEDIADGERVDIANIKGAGIINHIWITI